MADIAPDISRRHQPVFVVCVRATCGTNSPGYAAISTYLLTHVIALMSSTTLTDPLAMKTVVRRFCVEQDRIVFARVGTGSSTAGLIMPDDLVFKAWTVYKRVEAKDLVQDNLRVVGNAPVEMDVETTIFGQQFIEQCQYFV